MDREEAIRAIKELLNIADNPYRPTMEEMQKNVEMCKKTVEVDNVIFGKEG